MHRRVNRCTCRRRGRSLPAPMRHSGPPAGPVSPMTAPGPVSRSWSGPARWQTARCFSASPRLPWPTCRRFKPCCPARLGTCSRSTYCASRHGAPCPGISTTRRCIFLNVGCCCRSALTNAVTWIGHDAAAYPQGTLWTGDFSFPHQVDNPAATQRVVLAIDIRFDAVVRRLLPAPLTTDPGQRRGLAQAAQNLLLQWRAHPRQQEPADAHP